MVTRLMALAMMAVIAAPAGAATYVVLPSPGSMTAATIVVDENGQQGPVFICSSLSDISSGTCRLHRKSGRR